VDVLALFEGLPQGADIGHVRGQRSSICE
jgi:hypothetical protein